MIRAGVAAACILACGALSKSPPKLESRVTLEVLPDSAVLRVLARSQLEFVADLFWVRMVSIAARATTARETAALLPLGHLIADLAPPFKYPYFLAGVLAPVRRGRSNEYDNAKEAVALMARGVEKVPWERLHLQKAYTELEMLHDPIAAARTLTNLASQPGAPAYVGPLATRLLAQSGEFDDARELARSMARSDDPAVKADGEIRLKQIDLEETLVRVDAAVDRFTASEGHSPTRVEQLVRLGLLPELPADPFGGEIQLTPAGAMSSASPKRFRTFLPAGDD